MKIALVAHAAPSRELAARLAGGLSASGHHVTVHGQDSTADDGQLLARAGEIAASLRARWERDRPDVVHALHWTTGLAALAATRDSGVPVVQTFGSLAAAERRWRRVPAVLAARRARLESAIARGARVVIAGSSGEQADLASLGVPRTAVRVIPRGVDTAEFTPEGPAARRGPAPRLITVTGPAGLDACDELAGLLRVLARVPGAELVIAGGPPRAALRDDPAYRKLASLAACLGVAGRAVFAGQVSRGARPALLRSADLMIATPEYDPAGTSALEAMACGTPVIAVADGGPLADAVIDGATGVLADPCPPAALAGKIRDLLGRPMMLEAFGVASADRARCRYGWERITAETLAAYQAAAGTGPAAS
jgi:glycosyltransferase involved in cell wall biosynthesis